MESLDAVYGFCVSIEDESLNEIVQFTVHN